LQSRTALKSAAKFAEKLVIILRLVYGGKQLTMNLLLAPRAILDTNAVLDWLVFDNPGMQALSQAIQTGTIAWLSCPTMRDEFSRIVKHTSLATWSPNSEQALTAFDRWAQLCDAPSTPPPGLTLRPSDPDDQVFIDLALEQQARWLVTRDKALLKLARQARASGVAVLTPQAWCTAHAALKQKP
jgi:putative PIN family toxin of toxin-antitoxin system